MRVQSPPLRSSTGKVEVGRRGEPRRRMLQVRFTMSGTRIGGIEEEAKSCKGRRIDLSPTVAEALRVKGQGHTAAHVGEVRAASPCTHQARTRTRQA